MPKYASAKHAFGLCDRCGQRCKLNALKPLTINTKLVNLRVCPDCWEPDQPQYRVGRIKMDDPQALKNARPDFNFPAFRSIKWGWNPLMGMELDLQLGTVTVTIT